MMDAVERTRERLNERLDLVERLLILRALEEAKA